ncbi:F-box/kelch-repeat protein At3g23880-like [Lotus japonicus]|uniref:F-box/kelch-repeat protein At3g23880-like n=1 Tax=Lotus japonicus TaxID=34305 RepID=UPI0025838139|nr:F-box/kelch-repeat protein At3g23880-like [Lotus japonicus]
MAPVNEADAPPRTRQRLLSSSSNPPGDSLQAPPLPSLPFDLVVEIMCRLPVKPVLRFRCVCKSWKSLISDPRFAKKHLRCSPKTDFTRHHLILHYNTSSRRRRKDYVHTDYPLLSVLNAAMPTPTTTTTTQFKFDQNNLHSIVGSCDGIICIVADYGNSIILWNPSIRRFNILPSSMESPRLYGFGYDNLSDTYKIVAISCYSDYQTQVKVHTLGTHCWRKIQDFLPSCEPFVGTTGIFVSDTLNWLSYEEGANCFIMSLHLGNECYRKLLLPPNGAGPDGLGVLRDCLSMLSGNYQVCDVWLMKEYGNQQSWTKLFSVAKQLFHHQVFDTLHIFEEDQLLLVCGSKLYLYHPRDNTLKTHQIQNITGWVVPGVYVESLISPSLDRY